MLRITGTLTILILIYSCAVVRPGEVGVVRKYGKLKEPKFEGVVFLNPFTSKLIKVPNRTVNREINVNLPSKEGLTIQSQISILYRINSDMVNTIVRDIGTEYDDVLLSVFRSAAADITSQYYAKDMHSGERFAIEQRIGDRMNELLNKKGFNIESVLLKSIQLPAGLSKAIEHKLEAEQEAQRMKFTKRYEELEAERKLIKAQGERKSQLVKAEADKDVAKVNAEANAQSMKIEAVARKEVTQIDAEAKADALRVEADARAEAYQKINNRLTPSVLQSLQIEAFEGLSNSPNSKLIITDGKTPFLSIPD